jgi:hypothetical protein
MGSTRLFIRESDVPYVSGVVRETQPIDGCTKLPREEYNGGVGVTELPMSKYETGVKAMSETNEMERGRA